MQYHFLGSEFPKFVRLPQTLHNSTLLYRYTQLHCFTHQNVMNCHSDFIFLLNGPLCQTFCWHRTSVVSIQCGYSHYQNRHQLLTYISIIVLVWLLVLHKYPFIPSKEPTREPIVLYRGFLISLAHEKFYNCHYGFHRWLQYSFPFQHVRVINLNGYSSERMTNRSLLD